MRGSMLTMLIILLISIACSRNEDPLVYEQIGEHWRVSINDKVIKHHGKDHFEVNYTYLGDVEELKAIDKVSFAQGSELGTQVKTVYSPSYMLPIVENKRWEEAYEGQFAEMTVDMNNITNQTFVIPYEFIIDNSGTSSLDYLRNKALIIIEWQINGEQYRETLQ